jgi:hypothetical protein
MTADVVRFHTIQRVLDEFLQWRAPALDRETLRTYRRCIALFENSIDFHAPTCLAASNAGGQQSRPFCEVFGPEKIPGEIRYFLQDFLGDAVSAELDVLEQAPTIVGDLCSWLEYQGHVPESDLEAAIDDLAAFPPVDHQDSVNA